MAAPFFPWNLQKPWSNIWIYSLEPDLWSFCRICWFHFQHKKTSIPSCFTHWPQFGQTNQDHCLFPKQQLEWFFKSYFRSSTPLPSPYIGLHGSSPPALLPSLTSSVSFSFTHSVPAKLAPRMPLNTPGTFPPQGLYMCCFFCQDAPPPHAWKACSLTSFTSTCVHYFLRRYSLTILLNWISSSPTLEINDPLPIFTYYFLGYIHLICSYCPVSLNVMTASWELECPLFCSLL